MLGQEAIRQHLRRIQPVQTKIVNEIRTSFFSKKSLSSLLKTKFESPDSDQVQTVVKRTNHTVTTADN